MSLRTLLRAKPSFPSLSRRCSQYRMLSIPFPSPPETWGFPVVRTDYSNDSLFNSFVTALKAQSHEDLVYWGGDVRLEPYLVWTILEDRQTLDGANLDTARRYFRSWVERQPPRHDEEARRPSPRNNYFLLVNKHVLDEFTKVEEEDALVIVVEGDWYPGKYRDCYDERHHSGIDPPEDEGGKAQEIQPGKNKDKDDEYDEDNEDEELIRLDPVDGSTEPVLGWMYSRISCIPWLYDGIFFRADWFEHYARPPQAYPDTDAYWKPRGM